MPYTHLYIDFLIAFLAALLFGSVLAAFFQREKGLAGMALLFFALALLIWAGGIWLVPFGPVIFGAYPFPFLLTGLVLALFAAALSSNRPRRMAPPMPTAGRLPAEPELGPLVAVIWLLIALLAVLIVIRYQSGLCCL